MLEPRERCKLCCVAPAGLGGLNPPLSCEVEKGHRCASLMPFPATAVADTTDLKEPYIGSEIKVQCTCAEAGLQTAGDWYRLFTRLESRILVRDKSASIALDNYFHGPPSLSCGCTYVLLHSIPKVNKKARKPVNSN